MAVFIDFWSLWRLITSSWWWAVPDLQWRSTNTAGHPSPRWLCAKCWPAVVTALWAESLRSMWFRVFWGPYRDVFFVKPAWMFELIHSEQGALRRQRPYWLAWHWKKLYDLAEGTDVAFPYIHGSITCPSFGIKCCSKRFVWEFLAKLCVYIFWLSCLIFILGTEVQYYWPPDIIGR